MRHSLKAIALLVALLTCSIGYSKTPLKAVIVTGQNNHNWPVSSVAMKQTLGQSGKFEVTIAQSPAAGQDMSGFNVAFKDYDVVVVDYNGDDWSESMRQGFVEYAKGGGGIIFYHAADNAFTQWEEYNKMIALGGWGGRTEKDGPYVYWQDGHLVKDMTPGFGGSHGQQHEYTMNRRCKHPVARTLPKHWVHAKDELYDRMRGPGNIKDLIYTAWSPLEKGGSGREEPLVFTVDYGNARIMHIMIGHAGPTLEDNPAMDCPGFKTILVRSALWCAGKLGK